MHAELLHLPPNSTDAAVFAPRNTIPVVDPPTHDGSVPHLAPSIITILIFLQPFPIAPF